MTDRLEAPPQPLSVVKKNRRHDGIIQNGASIQQQAQTLGKVVAPAVHLSEPIDGRLPSNRSPSIQSGVESRPNLLDRVQFKRDQDVLLVAPAEEPLQKSHDPASRSRLRRIVILF